jgi:outer membrane protein assembly factor BamA
VRYFSRSAAITSTFAFFAVLPAIGAQDGSSSTIVSSITFSGNQITQEYVLAREVTLHKGEPFSTEKLEESVRNLRNLRIFRDVLAQVEHTSQGERVTFQILEKQTLLPFFRLKRGGGSTLWVVGIGDLNTLGHGFELLPMYENLNGHHHGARIDVRVPKIDGMPLTLDGTLASESRTHVLYENNGSVQQKYDERKNVSRITVEHPLAKWATAALTGTYEDSNTYQKSWHTISRLDLGTINYKDWKLTGSRLSLQYENITPLGKTSNDAHVASLEMKTFISASENVDVALRGVASQWWDAKNSAQQCTIGGFSEVRGFLDERYRGSHCWFANAETRVAAWKNNWLVLQPTLFLDTGRASTSWNQKTFSVDLNPTSLGAGTRFVFPYLARLILRADLAFPVNPKGEPPALSFGSVQFF